jgi:nicotinate-nucleotide pyrophosphorylase (carboxylating)
MNQTSPELPDDIETCVRNALREDIGAGDITALLISPETPALARVIARESAIICGIPWANEVLRQVSPEINASWQIAEGESVSSAQLLLELQGPARALLTAERTMLNFLQTLSGTATVSRQYAVSVAHTQVKLLDTRKTIPGLRTAQKYAVRVGGCHNHRMGLFDAFLIKENHINACGSIAAAVARAHQVAPGKAVEVEVESLDELDQAMQAGADVIMLDNFSQENMVSAVLKNAQRGHLACKLEASGGITKENMAAIAETGVDFISIGALTKDVRAIDLSMRFDMRFD